MSKQVKHIVISGPENTGKTTLSEALQKKIGGIVVPEFARKYLTDYGPSYIRQDLKIIAFGQFQSQLGAISMAEDFVVSDTCLLTIKIWSEWKYGTVDPFIEEWASLQKIDLYLLCKPDLAWEMDPLRENKDDLEALYNRYLEEIKNTGIPFVVIEGQGSSRLDKAIANMQEIGILKK